MYTQIHYRDHACDVGQRRASQGALRESRTCMLPGPMGTCAQTRATRKHATRHPANRNGGIQRATILLLRTRRSEVQFVSRLLTLNLNLLKIGLISFLGGVGHRCGTSDQCPPLSPRVQSSTPSTHGWRALVARGQKRWWCRRQCVK